MKNWYHNLLCDCQKCKDLDIWLEATENTIRQQLKAFHCIPGIKYRVRENQILVDYPDGSSIVTTVDGTKVTTKGVKRLG